MEKAKLRVEALEARLAPAIFVWQGDVSDDWLDGDNWDLGAPPGADDQALLVGGGNAPRVPSSSLVRVASVVTGATFGGGTSLTVDGSLELMGSEDSYWIMWAYLTGSGTLTIHGDFFWGDGYLDVASIDIAEEGRLCVGGDAGVGLTSGLASSHVNVWGEFILGGTAAAGLVPMNGNMRISDNTSIAVQEYGKLRFLQQEAGEGERGGIENMLFHSAQPINVYGFVTRQGDSSTVYCSAPLYLMEGGEFILEDDTSFRFTDDAGDFYPSVTAYTGGEVHMGKAAVLTVGDRLVLDDGDLLTWGVGDWTNWYIYGTIDVYAGNVYVGVECLGGLQVANGDVNIYGGAWLFEVSGGLDDESDLVNCWNGTIYFDINNDASLFVTSLAEPDPVAQYMLFQGTANDIAFDADFVNFYWFGEYQAGYQHGLNNDEDAYLLWA